MFWRMVLVAAWLGLAPSAAFAQRIAIADIDAPEQLDEEAGALTLVLRTYLGSRKQRVPRADLAKAIAVAGQLRPGRMTVKPENAPEVIEAVKGSVLLLSELRHKGPTLELVMHGYGPDGKAQTAAVNVPLGDFDGLARKAVEQGARLVGVIALDRPKLGSFGRMAAAGSASNALTDGKIKIIARRFSAAPPRLGYEVRAVRDVSAVILAAEGLDLDLRINAALIAGDLDSARELAKSDDPVAIAARARVQMAQLDFRKAGATLAKAKRSKHPFVILARGALASELGKKGEASKHYGGLMGDRPYLPGLAMAARLPPKALDKATEKKVIASAAAIRDEHPGLASTLGVRALRGGARSKRVFDLIDVYMLSVAELKELKIALDSLESDKRVLRLLAEVAVREGDLAAARNFSTRAMRLYKDDPRVVVTAELLEKSDIEDSGKTGDTVETTPVGSGVSKATLASESKVESMTLLVADLELLLREFPSLKRKLGAIALVPREGNREFILWPLQVDSERLSDGLASALAQAPWELPTVAISSPVGPNPTQQQLARIAEDHAVGGVLIYSIRTKGQNAELKLTLYSGGKSVETLKELLKTARKHGLVYWNPVFVISLSSLFGAIILWLLFTIIRGSGTVRLELRTDPAGERPSFSVRISKKAVCPTVTDPKAHLTSIGPAEKMKRLKADNVGAVAEFERVPPGNWFVHVFGTYEKGGELRCLPELTGIAKVKRNRVELVKIDLVPKESEFQIMVSDDRGPASGAELWLSTLPGKRYRSDAGGKAVVFAPTGEHVLHVNHRGQAITKALSAFGSRVHNVTINLTRERRLAKVAAGLEVGLPSDEPAEIINSSGQTMAIGSGVEEAQMSQAEMSQAQVGTSATLMPLPAPAAATPIPIAGSSSGPVAHGSSGGGLSGLQRYKPGDELGRGAMGVVYRAIDQVLDRAVALKVMAREFREHPKAMQMFQQEAKALAALNHPNVVGVYDQGQDGDEIFMVMEFVEGQTLEEILDRHGRLPLANAVGIGEQLGRGLAYAHSRRVIHRDIKPGNVFISKDGTVKLGDFGLAKILNEVQIKKTEIKGTPLYMAPEQIRGADIDFRADIYALGCTLYEVLAGRPPFIEGEILWHHVYTEPEPLTNHVAVPEQVASLIMKCIVKDKEHRVGSAKEIADVFGSIRRSL